MQTFDAMASILCERRAWQVIIINDKVIGRRVQAARLQKKLSQADLAALLDVSVSYVSRIECGKIRLNLERIIEISLLLDVSILDVIDGCYASTEQAASEHITPPAKERLYQLINTATPRALELMQELCESVYRLVP